MAEENRGHHSEGRKRAFFGIPAKVVVTFGQMIAIFVFVLSAGVLILLGNSGMSIDEMGSSKQYVDTSDCAQTMFNYMNNISRQLRFSRKFEKDGVLNGELKVDITNSEVWDSESEMPDETSMNPETSYTLDQLQVIVDKNLAYELYELYSQYQVNNFGNGGYEGAYGYYYSRLSRDYLEDEGVEYTKEEVEEAVTAALNKDNSGDGKNPAASQIGSTTLKLTGDEIALAKKIQELSGQSITTFSDAFLFLFEQGDALERQVKTVSEGTLAEYAAKNKDSVSLQELYEQLVNAVGNLDSYVSTESLLEIAYGSSNVRFYIKDGKDNIYTNVSEWKDDADAVDKVDSESGLSIWFQRKDGIITNVEQQGKDTSAGRYLKQIYTNHLVMDRNETVFLGLDTNLSYNDAIYQAAKTYDTYLPWARMLVAFAVASFVIWLILIVLGTIQAGRNAYTRTICLHGIDRIPTEVGIALGIIGGGLIISLGVLGFSGSIQYEVSVWVLALAAALATVCYGLCLIFYYSLVRRIKGKNLWKNSLLHSIVSLCRNVYAARNTSTKLILVFGGFVFVHFVLLYRGATLSVILCLIVDAVVLLYLIREASGRQTVLEGLQQIGAGDLEYKVDTTNLIGNNLDLAETVNRVGEGLQASIKEQMKSERLKADLITNVSHDIKTPLTSIINYVDLLKRENIQDAKIKGYIDILDSKSQRLKQLTEDLVEASKVSSGNVKLEFITLNLNELVQQMNGEFDERFNNRNLTVYSKLSREALRISADGPRIWRVLENLYSNAAKYAMPGTRVYIETEKKDGKVILTIKNVSENPLNIEADQLTERFIRGDVSRSTEGSGLGLSIAQNLTRLQHGNFDIYLDGDLFKVTLTFNEVKEPLKSDMDLNGEEEAQGGDDLELDK